MSEETKEQLKPCPFCDSIDIDVSLDCECYRFYEVTCNDCSVQCCGNTEKEAINNWNRRKGKW